MNKRVKFSNVIFGKLRIMWHLAFWGAAFIILLKLFANADVIEKIDLIYTLVFLFPIIIAVYINLNIAVTYLLRKEKYLYYLLSLPILVILTSAFILKLFDKWIDYILRDYYLISTLEMSDLFIYTSIFLVLTTLLKLSKEWFLLMQFEKEKSIIQLQQLQSQINPHFLLNSLQTIYSLSLHQSDKTSNSILQLSEILKFTLYESEEELVSLEREIEVVNDYVEMYRLRLDPIRAKIDLNISGEAKDNKIIPMLFLPFIENSFKHGLQGSEKEAFVNINFQINEKNLTFTIENNMGDVDSIEKPGYRGIGISNTKKRLELIYQGKYDLKIEEAGNIYKVKLTLDLSKA